MLYGTVYTGEVPSGSAAMATRNLDWWKGKRLRELRERRNWTLAYVANKLGVSVVAVSKWELNKSVPDLENFFKLCILFSNTPDFLFGLVEQPFKRIEEEKLSPDERELIRVYRAGQLPAALGQLLLANLENAKNQFPLIENEGKDSKASKNKTSKR